MSNPRFNFTEYPMVAHFLLSTALVAGNPSLDEPMDVSSSEGREVVENSSMGEKAEDPTASESTNDRARPMHIDIRHIEGRGVGYDKGYTTLDAFFSPIGMDPSLIPFVDLRGHIFNDGKYAANVGLGTRSRLSSHCLGLGGNVFYDYRQSHHQVYHQVGAGIELLGPCWDVHINGYLPFAHKKSHSFNRQITGGLGAPAFAQFSGHNLYFSLVGLKDMRTVEFAMKGVDADVGFQIAKTQNIAFDGSLGPYYYWGYFEKYAAGGRAKITATWAKYFSLGVYASYDNLFHARAQGEIALTFPFGHKEIKKHKEGSPICAYPDQFAQKFVRNVDRSEIIVLDKHQTSRSATGGTFVAIDPNTGLPYIFWFVDNTSHSNGTFESPYNTLAAAESASAPNDIIYVFPGDGTTTGMDAGITLQDGQMLLGSGLSYDFLTQFGLITVPNLSSTAPHLTAPANTPVVNTQNGNKVSGLKVTANGAGSFCIGNDASAGFTNLIVTHNELFLLGTASPGVEMENATGTLLVANNTLTGVGSGSSIGFDLDLYNGQLLDIQITGNTISNVSTGMFCLPGFGPPTTRLTGTISNNTIDGDFEFGALQNANVTLDFTGNMFTGPSGNLAFSISANGIGSCNILNNSFTGIAGSGVSINSQGTSNLTCTILNNAFSNNGTAGATIRSQGSSSMHADISGNTFTNNTGVGVAAASEDTSKFCLRFKDNNSTTADTYTLTRTAPSTFTISSMSGNNPAPVQVGVFTPCPTVFCPCD